MIWGSEQSIFRDTISESQSIRKGIGGLVKVSYKSGSTPPHVLLSTFDSLDPEPASTVDDINPAILQGP